MKKKYLAAACLVVCLLMFQSCAAEEAFRATKMDIEEDLILSDIYPRVTACAEAYGEEMILASEALKESEAWMLKRKAITENGEDRWQVCELKDGESAYYSKGHPIESELYEKLFEGLSEELSQGCWKRLLTGNRSTLAIACYGEAVDFQMGHVDEILAGVDYGIYYIPCGCCDGREPIEKLSRHMSQEQWESLSTGSFEYYWEDLGDGFYLYMWRG